MKKLLIIGGGISGLLAANVMMKNPIEITMLEPNVIGGEFLYGGLKYINKKKSMIKLFEELDLPFSTYMIKGGILLRGAVEPYPLALRNMPNEQSSRVRKDHYRKTRCSEPGAWSKTAMNDPAAINPKKALRTDFVDLVDSLNRVVSDRVEIKAKSLTEIGSRVAWLDDGTVEKFDYLILTIPLWVMNKMNAPYHIHEGFAMNLNVIDVVPKKDPYVKWDYVYTTYTPSNSVHRFSARTEGYSVEVNGVYDEAKVASDLNFLFPGGWKVERIKRNLKGYLFPLEMATEWPDNHAPLGRFARWNNRTTLDVTLEDAMELNEKWFG